MFSTYCHICDHNNGDLTPYNRLLRSFAKRLLPNYDIRNIKHAPPMLIDIYHLVETFLYLRFVETNDLHHEAFRFDFWDVRITNIVLLDLADYINRHFNVVENDPYHCLWAVRQDFVFGSVVHSSEDGLFENSYIIDAMAESSVPRITNPSKISKGYILNGNDFRMLYKDFNEMRRFIIALDSVQGYEEARHATGKYLEKSRRKWPHQFVGPYVEGVEAGTIQLRGVVEWRNGSVYSRSFTAPFTAKIAGDNQPYKNQSTTYPRTFAGDVSYYYSPRLVFVYSVACHRQASEAPFFRNWFIEAAVEIPLAQIKRSTTLPIWSFDFDLSAIFDQTILPKVQSLWRDFGTEQFVTIQVNGQGFYLDTGTKSSPTSPTGFAWLCPDGWDYTPQETHSI